MDGLWQRRRSTRQERSKSGRHYGIASLRSDEGYQRPKETQEILAEKIPVCYGLACQSVPGPGLSRSNLALPLQTQELVFDSGFKRTFLWGGQRKKRIPIRALNGCKREGRTCARSLKRVGWRVYGGCRASIVESTRKHVIQGLESGLRIGQPGNTRFFVLLATNLQLDVPLLSFCTYE